MLTLELIYALLQGLPADHLDFLDRPWYLLATRIQRALKDGSDPLAALRSALSASPQWERQVFLRAFLQEEPVFALPDLTQRQKEALIALRYAGACSLSQLSRILAQDRGNTSRRLDVLIEKGYAVKYFRREGPCYLAITSPLDDHAKSQVAGLMQAFKQALQAEQGASPSDNSQAHAGDVPYPAEPGARPLLPRKGTSNASASVDTQTHQAVDVPCPAELGRNSNASASVDTQTHQAVDVPCPAELGRNSNASASFADATSSTTPTATTKPTSATAPTNPTSESRDTKHTILGHLPRPP